MASYSVIKNKMVAILIYSINSYDSHFVSNQGYYVLLSLAAALITYYA